MVHIHAVTHQNLEEDMLYRCLVDSGAIGKVEDRKVTCTITNPSRSLTENHITSLADGTYRIGCYTPFEEGTVRSVKKETEELFLLTPLNEDMLSQVNSIIKGCVYLPNTIFCNPPESVTGHVPHTSVSNNVLSGVVKKLIIKP